MTTNKEWPGSSRALALKDGEYQEEVEVVQRRYLSPVRHLHHLIYTDGANIIGEDFWFCIRSGDVGMCKTSSKTFKGVIPFERGKSRGGAPDYFRKLTIEWTDKLMYTVVIGSALHVGREFTSKAGDQQNDLTLGIVGGGGRELAKLRLRLLKQLMQFNRKLWQTRTRSIVNEWQRN